MNLFGTRRITDWFGSPKTPRSPRLSEPVCRVLNDARGRIAARLQTEGDERWLVQFDDGTELWLHAQAIRPCRDVS